jgi:hypothetical protein
MHEHLFQAATKTKTRCVLAGIERGGPDSLTTLALLSYVEQGEKLVG